MIKLVYTTGDSFAFGQELGAVDAQAGALFEFTSHMRKHCYTGIIADKIGAIEYINSACPGGSNERAYRMLINDLSKKIKVYKPEEIFVFLSLTHATRREFCFSDRGDYYIHINAWEPPSDPTSPNLKHHRLWEVLVKDFDYDYGHFMYDMMIILAIQNFLRSNKIPYLLTSSMGSHTEEKIQKMYISDHLFEQVHSLRCLLQPSFIKFARTNNFPIGPSLHPLEEGHAQWAKHLLDYITKNNLFSNGDLL